MSNIVYVYDTNNNRHIMSAQSVSEHDIENGLVVLDDDHKCPECHEYIKGERVDYGG